MAAHDPLGEPGASAYGVIGEAETYDRVGWLAAGLLLDGGCIEADIVYAHLQGENILSAIVSAGSQFVDVVRHQGC